MDSKGHERICLKKKPYKEQSPMINIKAKGKVIPLQARSDPEGG